MILVEPEYEISSVFDSLFERIYAILENDVFKIFAINLCE